MSYYPIFLDLEGRHVVIAGGGSVSERKAETLMRAGAHVTVIAPECTNEIARYAAEGSLDLQQKSYDANDLAGATLVIAATNVPEVNAQIARDCRERGILVNVIDDTALCDFIVPAIVDTGSIQIAVSTGGKSPAFARVVKRAVHDAIGAEYAELNDILGSLRDAAKASSRLPDDADRKRFFDEILARGILELLRDGRRSEAYRAVAEICDANGVALSELVRDGLRA